MSTKILTLLDYGDALCAVKESLIELENSLVQLEKSHDNDPEVASRLLNAVNTLVALECSQEKSRIILQLTLPLLEKVILYFTDLPGTQETEGPPTQPNTLDWTLMELVLHYATLALDTSDDEVQDQAYSWLQEQWMQEALRSFQGQHPGKHHETIQWLLLSACFTHLHKKPGAAMTWLEQLSPEQISWLQEVPPSDEQGVLLFLRFHQLMTSIQCTFGDVIQAQTHGNQVLDFHKQHPEHGCQLPCCKAYQILDIANQFFQLNQYDAVTETLDLALYFSKQVINQGFHVPTVRIPSLLLQAATCWQLNRQEHGKWEITQTKLQDFFEDIFEEYSPNQGFGELLESIEYLWEHKVFALVKVLCIWGLDKIHSFEEADTQISHASDFMDWHINLLAYLSRAACRLSEWELACEALEQENRLLIEYITENPQPSYIFNNYQQLAQLYHKQGKYLEAIQALKALDDFAKNHYIHKPLELALAYELKAACFAAQKEYTHSIEALQEMLLHLSAQESLDIQVLSNQCNAWYNLGIIYKNLNQKEEAEYYFEKSYREALPWSSPYLLYPLTELLLLFENEVPEKFQLYFQETIQVLNNYQEKHHRLEPESLFFLLSQVKSFDERKHFEAGCSLYEHLLGEVSHEPELSAKRQEWVAMCYKRYGMYCYQHNALDKAIVLLSEAQNCYLEFGLKFGQDLLDIEETLELAKTKYKLFQMENSSSK